MFFLVQIGCRADYTFIQTYHSYVNPLHNRANGICCDNPSSRPPCDTFCDNMFTLCVTHTGQALPEVGNIQSEDCPLGFLLSQTFFNSDNITFNTSAPVVFTGDIWPVRYINNSRDSYLVTHCLASLLTTYCRDHFSCWYKWWMMTSIIQMISLTH